MFSWKVVPLVLMLLAPSQKLLAQQALQPQAVFLSWKPAEVAEPLVIRSEDLSENNGTFTYQTDMERNKLVNIAFELGDIFSLGAAAGKHLEIRMSGLSDVAPDCRAIAANLGLSGVTNCRAFYGSSSYSLDTQGGRSNLSCENIKRNVYATQTVCDDDLASLRPCPNENFGPDRRLLRRPSCPRKPICRPRKVLVDTVIDRHCTEDFYTVNFNVHSFESLNGINTIQSYVGFESVSKRTRKTVNGAIKQLVSPVALTSPSRTIASTTYFSLVCDNNRLIGQTFNHSLQTIFYNDIISACGSEGKIYLRSNRPLLFDTGAISLTFEKPS